jgi:hypothetical protein
MRYRLLIQKTLREQIDLFLREQGEDRNGSSKAKLVSPRGGLQSGSSSKRRATHEHQANSTVDLTSDNDLVQTRQVCRKTGLDVSDVNMPAAMDTDDFGTPPRRRAQEGLAAFKKRKAAAQLTPPVAKRPVRYHSSQCFDAHKGTALLEEPQTHKIDASINAEQKSKHIDISDESLHEMHERPVATDPMPGPWKYNLTYPIKGPRSATMHYHDLDRLKDNEYLNDTIIDFYARWLREKYPEQAKLVHIFSSYFFTTLIDSRMSNADSRYAGVKRWTKADTFQGIDYLAVPVNQDLHWYLVIICNLSAIVSSDPAPADYQESPTSSGDSSPPALSSGGRSSARKTPKTSQELNM